VKRIERVVVSFLLRLNSILTKMWRIFLPNIKTLDELTSKNSKTSYGNYTYDEARKEYNLFFSESLKLEGNKILDVGCGSGGKTCFYARNNFCVGLDVDQVRLKKAINFSRERVLEQNFRCALGDSARLPFKSESFNIVFINDVMEHLENPSSTLKEATRILKRGGYMYITFTSYNAANGSHLTDWIRIPWIHFLFPEKVIIRALLQLSEKKPIILYKFPRLKSSLIPKRITDFVDINGITLKKFKHIITAINSQSELSIRLLTFRSWYHENHTRSILEKLPESITDFLARKVVCILEKV
jgi:ubiquinone/menaquinone biosynthesis C-methylase UbiE